MGDIEAERDAPAFGELTALIHAPIETVWDTLTDLQSWPTWNKSVSEMDALGALAEGTHFHWTANGMKIKSCIESLDAPRRIVWSGHTLGVSAIHSWQLAPEGEATRVHTEESFRGMAARLLPGRMKAQITKALQQGIEALKTEAERRSR